MNSDILTKERISSRVVRTIEEFAGIKQLKISDSISSLGFDSLDKVEFILFLEDEFDIELLDDNLIEQFSIIGDIVDYITKEMKCVE